MRLKTILNHVEKNKSFVYEHARLERKQGDAHIVIDIKPRLNARPLCSKCGKPAPGYDRLDARLFQYVPLFGIAVFFLYAMRRVNCSTCGVTVEKVPWADGKSPMTRTLMCFLSHWAKRLSWKEVARIFGATWNQVYEAVSYVVGYGLDHRDLSGVEAVGVDEKAWKKGHNYLTLVYQIDAGCRRLLWVGHARTEATLREFFSWFGAARCAALRFVASDMWKPYINVIREYAVNALHILDRFHIMMNLHKAVDEARRQETRRLKESGCDPVLSQSRWCLLKRPANLTGKQIMKLSELLATNLQTTKAYLMKEDFQRFWDYEYAANAKKFLSEWCRRAMRSRIEPMKKFVGSLREHRELILNWFRAKKRYSCGIVEGLNYQVDLGSRKSFGYRTKNVLEIALYHRLGALPEPIMTHRFC